MLPTDFPRMQIESMIGNIYCFPSSLQFYVSYSRMHTLDTEMYTDGNGTVFQSGKLWIRNKLFDSECWQSKFGRVPGRATAICGFAEIDGRGFADLIVAVTCSFPSVFAATLFRYRHTVHLTFLYHSYCRPANSNHSGDCIAGRLINCP